MSVTLGFCAHSVCISYYDTITHLHEAVGSKEAQLVPERQPLYPVPNTALALSM